MLYHKVTFKDNFFLSIANLTIEINMKLIKCISKHALNIQNLDFETKLDRSRKKHDFGRLFEVVFL